MPSQVNTAKTINKAAFVSAMPVFAKMMLLIRPKFEHTEASKLNQQPKAKAVIKSEDSKSWCALEGWVKDLPDEGEGVQCRRSGLTIKLDSRVATNVNLLPFQKGSPNAQIVYTLNGNTKRVTITPYIDAKNRILKLTLPFEDNPAGKILYDEIVSAITTAPGITIQINYVHEYQVKAVPIIMRINPAIIGRHLRRPGRAQLTSRHLLRPGRAQPTSRHRAPPARPRQPAPRTPAQPAATATAMRINPAILRTAMLARRPDMSRVYVEPKKPASNQQIKYNNTTFNRSYNFKIQRQRDDSDTFPDILNVERRGWAQVQGRSDMLHYRDTAQIDVFDYMPCKFISGYYTSSDGSYVLPPMRAEHYRNETGEYRVKVTLVALPFIDDEDRSILRSHLINDLLKNMLPVVRMQVVAGLQANFSPSFSSGSAGDQAFLPQGIQFDAIEVDPDDRLVLQYDMQAWLYSIFCEMLRKGIHGTVQLKGEGIQESVEVQLKLDDIVTNTLKIQPQVEEAEIDETGVEEKTETDSPVIHLLLENLLTYPVFVKSMLVNLIHIGTGTGIVFEGESISVLPKGTKLNETGIEASSVTLNITPKNISQWNNTVIETGNVIVMGGSAEDWLNRVHQDPSLQAEGFHVKINAIIPATSADIQIIRLMVYKKGDTSLRLRNDIPPSPGPHDLPVKMTLAELMGEQGKPPEFILEFDTVMADGSISLTQRIMLDPEHDVLTLSVLVEKANHNYTVSYQEDGQQKEQELDRQGSQTLIERLRTEDKYWNVYAKQIQIEEPVPEPVEPEPVVTEPTDTGQPITSPSIDIITDLLTPHFSSGNLQSVFVILSADEDSATRSTHVFDNDNHDSIKWRPSGGTIPPFRYKITYLYTDGLPKTLQGTESNPVLLLDPPQEG